MINRRTCLTCDGIIRENYEILAYLLNLFEQIDPCLLEMLHYYYEEEIQEAPAKSLSMRGLSAGKEKNEMNNKITPLHLVFTEGNTRSINIFLKYMAKSVRYNSETIKDILPYLIQYRNFPEYLEGLLF